LAIDDLPLPVVNFLNAIGVPWPYINEDIVWEFASLVRQFRQAVVTTHKNATKAVTNIAKAHKGASTETMTSGWANLTASEVDGITTACKVLEDALDAAGGYIVAQKGIAITDLIGMATVFFADQAAAFLTAGFSEMALPLIEEGAEKIVRSLEMDLSQYIAGKVIEAAAKPLLAKVKEFLSGLDWSQSGGTAGPQDGVSVSPNAVEAQADVLRGEAASLHTQAVNLAAQMRNLKFT
jgi:hypothetical protein